MSVRDISAWAIGGAGSSGSITSGYVASGALIDVNMVSGTTTTNALLVGGAPMASGTGTLLPGIISVTAEDISGLRAVNFDGSGRLQIAMASLPLSGRMPAVGIAVGNAAAGNSITWFQLGGHQYQMAAGSSGTVDYSGYIGRRAWVGRSGQVVSISGAWNSGGHLSGDLGQSLGVIANSGGIYFNIDGVEWSGGPLGMATGGGVLI